MDKKKPSTASKGAAAPTKSSPKPSATASSGTTGAGKASVGASKGASASQPFTEATCTTSTGGKKSSLIASSLYNTVFVEKKRVKNFCRRKQHSSENNHHCCRLSLFRILCFGEGLGESKKCQKIAQWLSFATYWTSEQFWDLISRDVSRHRSAFLWLFFMARNNLVLLVYNFDSQPVAAAFVLDQNSHNFKKFLLF